MKPQTKSKTESNSNAAPSCSVSLPEPPPSRDCATIEDAIDQFICWIGKGIESWVYAGQVLEKLLKQDPHVFAKILNKCPWLTVDNLWTFYKIGTKQVRPEVVLAKGWLASKLLHFDYETQSILLDGTMDVVSGFSNGRPLVNRKSIREMSSAELDTLFDDNRLRSLAEQKKYLKEKETPPPALGTSKMQHLLAPIKVKTPFNPAISPETNVSVPASQPTRSMKSEGLYRLTLKFGRLTMERIPFSAQAQFAAQAVTLNDQMGDIAAIIDVKRWVET